MAGMSNQISNVLGVAIPYDLKRQLSVRSSKVSNDTRTSDDVLYLANKTCWVRLVSSVSIKDLQAFRKYFPDLDVKDPNALAKKFVLFGGTSEYKNKDESFSYNLRSGIGPNGAYGMLGDVETQLYGYKPMPGITSVRVDTQGKLGSVRVAQVDFKVNTKSQLDIIDALYFKMGYTMFLEWGHALYYDNGRDTRPPQLQRGDFDQIDPFKEGLIKENILRQISTKITNSNGNYDAMLGMCTNFDFTMNESGGYDCSVKIIGLGDLANEIKINQSNTLPGILDTEIKRLVKIFEEILRERQRQEQIAAQQAEDAAAAQRQLQQAREQRSAEEAMINEAIITLLLQERPRALIEALDSIVTIEQFRLIADALKNRDKSINQIIRNTISNTDGAVGQIMRGLTYTTKQLNDFNRGRLGSVIDLGSAIRRLQARVVGLRDRYNSSTEGQYSQYRYSDGTIEPLKSYSSMFEFIDDNKSTPEPLPTLIKPKNFKSQPITDAKLKDVLSTVSPVEALIAEKLYNAVKPRGTDEGAFVAAIEQIKSPESYLRVNSLVKAKGDDDLDILGWINNDFGIRDLQSVAKIAESLNKNAFRDNRIAGYEIGLVSDIISPTPFVGYKSDTFVIDLDAVKKLIIDSVEEPADAAQKTTSTNTEQPPAPTVESVQKDEALKYQSGLEVFIRAIQLHSFNVAYTQLGLKEGKIGTIDLADKKSEFAKQLFTNGILSKVALSFVDKVKDFATINDNFTKQQLLFSYASYGFNHNLMSRPFNDPTITEGIPQVDFKDLYKSYVIPYSVSQGIAKDIDINHPVYIKLGFLLFALNHMCTLYDSKEGQNVKSDDQTPLVYIDFNPETNFCLSEPLQMSTDVLKMLIQFRGTNTEYESLFNPKIIKSGAIVPPSGSTESTPLFKPETEDFISGQIPQFKGIDPNSGDAYRGKIMNILISCDYILSLCKNFANSDEKQSVKLKPFLQQIVDDINKYLGGINLLRVAYDDRSNCLYIVDDQVQPLARGERSPVEDRISAEIPVFGKSSIARSLQIKSEIPAKLSNMIAVSANSDIKSDASQDGTPFGHFNQGFVDRFIPQVLTVNTSETKTKKNDNEPNDVEKSVASRFNQFVKNALNNGNMTDEDTSFTTNYFIEKMNKRKGENLGTKSAALIPINLNFSLDGISGFSIGHAFLLPNQLLPLSFQQKSNDPNIPGFVVTGISHNLQDNSWTTEIKASMMYLKNSDQFKPEPLSYNIKQLASGNFIIQPISAITEYGANYPSNSGTSFTATNADAKAACDNYIGRTLSDLEFSELVSATFAESGGSVQENGYITAAMLNRARNKGKSVSEILREKNQFQSVTGTAADGHSPSKNFLNGPPSANAARIYQGMVQVLPTVARNIINFTAANLKAYGPGTNPGYIDTLKARGGVVVGQSWFSA
jgi:hypothetical protein